MRLIRVTLLSLCLLSFSVVSIAAPPEFSPIRKKPTATPTPNLKPVCDNVRCVLAEAGRGASCSNDSDCYVLGCVAGFCTRVEKGNPNLAAGKIPSCSQEGAKCGKSFCVMGASGKGLSCRGGMDPSPGLKECSNDDDCFGSKCVPSPNGLKLSCEVDKFSSNKTCVVGTPEGCMEKRCQRQGPKLAKVCDWARPGVFTDDKDAPLCSEVGTPCGGGSSSTSAYSSSSLSGGRPK